MPDAINSFAASSAASSAATAAPASANSLGKDTFLKLLVAQLKYQDPLKPSDPQQFLSQSAQFSTVEKLEEITKAITASSRTATLTTAAGLLGRTVSFTKMDGTTATGVVTSAQPTADGVKLSVGPLETTLDQVTDIRLT